MTTTNERLCGAREAETQTRETVDPRLGESANDAKRHTGVGGAGERRSTERVAHPRLAAHTMTLDVVTPHKPGDGRILQRCANTCVKLSLLVPLRSPHAHRHLQLLSLSSRGWAASTVQRASDGRGAHQGHSGARKGRDTRRARRCPHKMRFAHREGRQWEKGWPPPAALSPPPSGRTTLRTTQLPHFEKSESRNYWKTSHTF